MLFNIFSSPIILAFTVIVLGYLIGKIKIYRLSFDLSAILIVSVVAGYVFSIYFPSVLTTEFKSGVNLISKFGTALFVSCIGLTSGASVSKGINFRNITCFFIGIMMVIASVISMKMIILFDPNINHYVMLGILCGSLTTTPGLSAVCDIANANSDYAVLGYGCAYLFGVIGVVVFVQLMLLKADKSESFQSENTNIDKNVEIIFPLCLSIVTGSVLGELSTIGSSSGVLFVSILIGVILGKSKLNLSNEQMSFCRSLGLVLFFAGSGINAGNRLTSGFELKWFVYGIILTIIPIVCGYFITKIFLKGLSNTHLAVIAGGMTSSPAIGVLLRKSRASVDLSAYSFSYIGALITIILIVTV